MIEALNKSKIDYIFYHLNQHIDLTALQNHIVFDNKKFTGDKSHIFFPLSNLELTKTFRINDTPVLYPLSNKKEFFYLDKNNNLIFYHDLLKSAFYLLSGYQETQPFKGDQLGRFTYHDSIQKELGIADWPIVNEYFSIIIKGLTQFCKAHNIVLNKRSVWGAAEFALFLTHDVDRVDKWTFKEIKTRIDMLIRSGFLKGWNYLFEAIINYPSKKNPYWNFEWMKDLEKKYNFNSTWFFLPQGHPQIDAYYSFKEQRISELVRYFTECGDEIGLHGTFNSKEDPDIMKQNLDDVHNLSSRKIKKSRQHWLSFKHPDTLRILENLNIKYDSSWGFAEHYGWRNSYCLPFHPYDIDNDRMMTITELPLNAMDVTFFQYMNLDLEEAYRAFSKMINTCKKYNGLFVLLWHNSHFNETLLPGISRFYQNILQLLAENKPLLFKTNEPN